MKSPAILFYTSDFLTGTTFMTNEEVGQYIRLLCFQHQLGRLTLEQVKKITESDNVLCKFKIDKKGFYFNERMELEINKRNSYVDSRSRNKLGKIKDLKENHMKNISKSYENHMEDINDNINSILESNNISNNIRLLFIEYITLRKKNKLSNSNTVIVRLVNKLIEYGKTEEEQKEIIEKAILGNWKDFYEIENKKKREVVKYETVR